nr:inorganic pyrophosphatase homologue [Gluconobacter oxydans]
MDIMDVSKISPGKDLPNDINVVIEIPQGSQVKYEVDKDSGALVVDRFLFTPMPIRPPMASFRARWPRWRSGRRPCPDAGCRCAGLRDPRPSDRHAEDGRRERTGREDHLRPARKVHPQFSNVHSVDDLPEITKKAITHFFERYKDLEPNKWVKVTGWADKAEAGKVIMEALAAAK